ncbi:DUF4112 domain-containing protein [Loktanella agnita]|uniref:DUF4112 domain-containing protein n=1 Tax=Loktanella agnita TaxID=287097 RepID=UPI0039887D93
MSETAEIEQLERVAHRMDSLFRLPIIGVRVGLDSILGLLPGVGDVAALGPAGYIIYRAHNMGASRPLLARMMWNTGVDAAIGTIPLVGDIFDIGNKANKKNVALLRKHLEKKKGAATDALPNGVSG